jgi:SAM-dependent methyltransferase
MKITRKTLVYHSGRPPQDALRQRLRELAASRVRFGYRRLTVILRREGWRVNPKRVYRLYTEDGLTVRTKGEIENIPLPDNSVDVIISNCVINLSGDKDRVLAEAFRVLRPGGRFAVSDAVVRGEVPAAIRRSVELWIGCVAGALEESEYRARLLGAGFEQVDLEPTRIYRAADATDFFERANLDVEKIAPLIDGKFMSAFVRARKPAHPRLRDTRGE